jgi:hypothetical protein
VSGSNGGCSTTEVEAIEVFEDGKAGETGSVLERARLSVGVFGLEQLTVY